MHFLCKIHVHFAKQKYEVGMYASSIRVLPQTLGLSQKSTFALVIMALE